VTISYVFGFSSLEVADLDGDRTPDLLWTDGGSITVLLGRWRPPASLDSDRDGVPDECRPRPFRRGDADGRGGVELTDAILLLAHLFLGNRDALICPDGADADDNGALEVTDVIGILGYLFLAGDPPAAPGPLTCGPDPTADPLGSCLGASC
jgi:hypothetical protein